MKKRIIAIALVLMLAVSLFSVGALADDGIYLSIGGKEFTSIGQTVKVGGGTAKLTWEYGENPTLTLNNVNLTSFTKVDSLGGVDFYAGIVYVGGYELKVQINGSCTITAPKHGSNAWYDGIYLECSSVGFEGGALTIKGTETGVEQYGFATSEDSSYGPYNSGVYFNNSALNISCSGSDAYAIGEVTLRAKTSITTDFYYGIEAGTVDIGGDTTLTVTPRMSDGCYSASGISTDRFSCYENGSLNLTVNYDSGNLPAEEPVTVCGVYTDYTCVLYNVNSVVNIKGNTPVSAYAVLADTVYNFGSGNRAVCNFSGEHYPSAALRINSVFNSLGIPVVQAIITGASAGDVALLNMHGGKSAIGTLYASVDSDYALPTLSKCSGYSSNLNYSHTANVLTPAGGTFAKIEDESLGTVYTVVDVNREVTREVVISCNDYPFIDIESDSMKPYKDAIVWANDMKITSGFTPIEFRPDAACNRGQVVTFLWRAKGSPEPTLTKNPFVDVYESSPYYKAILWAVEQGITNGFDAAHFKPSNPCTRAQVVTFLWRTEGKPAPQSDNNPFKDVSTSGNTKPYYEAILWAAENGITGGYTPTEFRPNVTCNRGQVVTFIYRDMKDSIEEKPDVKKIANVSLDAEKEPTEDMLRIDFTPKNTEALSYFPLVFKVDYSDGTSEDIVLNIGQPVEEMPEKLAELVTFTDYKVYIKYFAYGLYQGYGTDDRWSILGFDVRNLEIIVNDAADEILELEDGRLLVLEYATPVEERVLYMADILTPETGEYKYIFIYGNGIEWKLIGDEFYYVSKHTVTTVDNVVVEEYYEVMVQYLSTGLYNILGRYPEQPVLDDTGYTVTTVVDGEEVTTHYDFPEFE